MPDCCPPVLPPVLPLPPLFPRASLALFKRLDIFVVFVEEVCLFWSDEDWMERNKATRRRVEVGYMPWSYVFEFIACVIA